MAETLATIAQHVTTAHLTVVLTLLTLADVVMLAVALYALKQRMDW